MNDDQLKSLCSVIELPNEVADEVLTLSATFDLTPLAPLMANLLSLDTAKEAHESLKSQLEEDDPRGFKMLTIFLSTALKSREMYIAKGIGENIFVETMKIFTRMSYEYHGANGCFGFDKGWWTYRQLSLSLFRLGILEFEIKPEDNTLSVHIPSDAVMTRESLNDSYTQAISFFAKHFADFKYTDIACHTWLLSPELKNLLPENSKILSFASDYEVKYNFPDEEDFMEWIFKKKYPTHDDLPEDTFLQRTVKAHLKANGKIGAAYGVYEGANPC